MTTRYTSTCLLLAISVATSSEVSVLAEDAGARPMLGFNTWDGLGRSVNETLFRSMASWQAEHLAPFGYTFAVIDGGWGDTDGGVDQYGRDVVVEDHWPSSKGGVGLAPLAKWCHDNGLRLGIHIRRGIKAVAVAENSKVMNTSYRMQDIVSNLSNCRNNAGSFFFGVNMTWPVGAGQAYYDSLIQLYAGWGIDLIKLDCAGNNLHRGDGLSEVAAVADAMQRLAPSMILSLSPGIHNATEAAQVASKVDLYRMSPDIHDCWDGVAPKPGTSTCTF